MSKLPLHLYVKRREDPECREGLRPWQLPSAPQTARHWGQASWVSSRGVSVSAPSKYRGWHTGTGEGQGGELTQQPHKTSTLKGYLLIYGKQANKKKNLPWKNTWLYNISLFGATQDNEDRSCNWLTRSPNTREVRLPRQLQKQWEGAVSTRSFCFSHLKSPSWVWIHTAILRADRVRVTQIATREMQIKTTY